MAENAERRYMAATFRVIKLWRFSPLWTFWLLFICQGIMKSPLINLFWPFSSHYLVSIQLSVLPSPSHLYFSPVGVVNSNHTAPLAALLLVKLLNPSEWSGLLVMLWFWNHSNKQCCCRGNFLETFVLHVSAGWWAVGRGVGVWKHCIAVSVLVIGPGTVGASKRWKLVNI